MSRRRGEFEHRTSIFEGAFRAWSHLGGLDPVDLETKTISELDPLNFPLINDTRKTASRKGGGKSNDDDDDDGGGQDDFDDGGGGGKGGGGGGGGAGGGNNSADDYAAADANRPVYPYEPLPRSGLAHPFVQAILSPWLGPDADQDAIQLGLTTLRTWWQHRRKGESGSAVAALGTDKMRGVVEGYTRHFFNLAYCLVVNEKDQPPRTLQTKMKVMEKNRIKKGKKRSRDDEVDAYQSGLFGHDPSRQGFQLQQHILQGMGPIMPPMGGGGVNTVESGGMFINRAIIEGGGPTNPAGGTAQPNGRWVPGKIDVPGLVQQVSSAATQLAHRGINMGNWSSSRNQEDPSKYGDPEVTPVVLVSTNHTTGANDVQFYMTIEGITCAHCVKIIETVLKGCPGSRSPIDGLLDAASDMDSSFVIIKIDNIKDCRRIAWESARSLSMVGYTAKAKSFMVPNGMSLENAYSLMEQTIPSVSPMMGFRWDHNCECPDNNVSRHNCPRHSLFHQSQEILEAFRKTEMLLSDPAIYRAAQGQLLAQHLAYEDDAADQKDEYKSYQQPIQDSSPGWGGGVDGDDGNGNGNAGMPIPQRQQRARQSSRLLSFSGIGGPGRLFSLSETTFGRAMSGLSALSIDWENMDDFDVNVDHSAGINNDIIKQQQDQAAQDQQGQWNGNESEQKNTGSGQDNEGYGQRAERRSSLRCNIPVTNGGSAHNVSFNMG